MIDAGYSVCPICKKYWQVTILEDCLLPTCGCYGSDTSANNLNRPCEHCGIHHAMSCNKENDMTISFDLQLTSFHKAWLTSNRLEKDVVLEIKDHDSGVMKLRMSAYAAERLWQALEDCIKHTEETRE